MFDIDKYMHKPFFGCTGGPDFPPPPGSPPVPHSCPPRYTMTEEVEHSARLMRETIDRLLKFEERVKRDVTDLSKNLTSDNVIFKNAMHESWTTFLMEVKNEINVFEANMESDIRMFKSEIETDYANFADSINTRFGEFETKYEQEFTALTSSIQEQYNTFAESVNARIDAYNENTAQAFADYQRKLQTELNSFEQTMNTNYQTFTESMGNSMHEFRTSLEQIVNERLTAQDAKLSDAEMYMKTNLEATVTTLIGDMHANGEFNEIIEGEVFNDLQRKVDGFGRMSVLYFGAVGDGETDNTAAFQLAVASGRKLFVPRGCYVVGALNLPAHCDILFEGELTNSHDEVYSEEYYSQKYAVMKLTGPVTLAAHCHIQGGVFFTEGVAFKVDVAAAEQQGLNLEKVAVIGDGSVNAIGVLIDASDNDESKTGYLSLSRFDMLINKCYYGYRINRPQKTGRHPWITFVTFEGSLTECYQGVSTEYGSIAHANGSGVYRLTCCGGAIYKNPDKAFIDISGDMPTVDCLFSDMGGAHSIKYGLDLDGCIRPTVFNYQQGHALIKGLSLHGERFVCGGMLKELTNSAMPDAKVYAVRSGGMIDYIFTGTFAQGTHVNFGEDSPYTRAPIDTTYRDAETNLLIQMPGSNQTILVSNETGANIVLTAPIKISVPHHTIN